MACFPGFPAGFQGLIHKTRPKEKSAFEGYAKPLNLKVSSIHS